MSLFLGTGIQYLVVTGPGQSNGPLEGRGTGTPTALTAPRAYVHGFDGALRPANDPVGSNTNNRYTTSAHASAVNSYAPALINALYNGGSGIYGANDAIILCGLNEGGTSATTWATSAGAAIPVANSRYGIWELRMRDLLRNLPNPKMLCLLADLGETNATDSTTAAAYDANMTTTANAMLTFLTTTMGLTWAKTLRIMMRILPDLAGTGFVNWSPPASPNVQDIQIAWAATRNGASANSVVTYKPPGGQTYTAADNLHFQTSSLATIGAAMGAAILAAA